MARKHVLLAAAITLGLAVTAVGASASTTSVTITSPRSGQIISLKKNPYLPVAGTASFAPTTRGATTFYLRRDGCGTSNDNPHLSVTSGTDEGDGCGLVLSIVGVGGDVDQGAFVDFPSSDGMPLTFDGSRNVQGTIDLESFSVSGAGIATGLVTVDVTMEALVHGNGVTIGSDSETVLATPTATNYPVSFTIQPNAAVDTADLSGVDLRVHVHGPYAFSGFIGNSGKSLVTLPSYAASVSRAVQVSLDDPSFANAIPARLDASVASWSLAIATPPVGKHTIYARSTQGFETSASTAQSFTVTK
ncbi:MAG: hypothetical protein ACXVRV_15475 [Gaiellaceae bacterium]